MDKEAHTNNENTMGIGAPLGSLLLVSQSAPRLSVRISVCVSI